MMWRAILIAALGLAASPVFAEESDQGWGGDAEVGGVWTSGNTENETLKVRLDVTYTSSPWMHTFHAENLNASQNGNTTAERTYAFYRMDFDINERSGFYTRAAIDDDKFSGYDIQADWTAGYSRKLIVQDTLRLNGDVGAGVRFLETDNGDETTEGVVRVAGLFEWDVSPNAMFSQELSVEAGEELTTWRSRTAITAQIAGSLSMSAAYAFRNNSRVIAGKDKTDTEATVTLVYSF